MQSYFVKDKVRTVLVEGMIKEELYQNAHVSCQSKRVDIRRLGHSSNRVLEEILKDCQIKL
jgi:hypothetical protein